MTAIIIPTAPALTNPNMKFKTFDFLIKGIILTKIATKINEGKNIPTLEYNAPVRPCN